MSYLYDSPIIPPSISRIPFFINICLGSEFFGVIFIAFTISHARCPCIGRTTRPISHMSLYQNMGSWLSIRIRDFCTYEFINLFWCNNLFIVLKEKQYMCMWEPLFLELYSINLCLKITSWKSQDITLYFLLHLRRFNMLTNIQNQKMILTYFNCAKNFVIL